MYDDKNTIKLLMKAMELRLTRTYGIALEVARNAFYEDPRTKLFLYNDENVLDIDIEDLDEDFAERHRYITTAFEIAADPEPADGSGGVVLFFNQMAKHYDADEAVTNAIEAIHEYTSRLKEGGFKKQLN